MTVRRRVAAFAVATLIVLAQPAAAMARPGDDTPSTVDPAAAWLARDKGIGLAEATRRIDAQNRLAWVGDRLVKQLGSRTGGAYFDEAGALNVTVTDPAAADTVRAAGATPRPVDRNTDALKAVIADLDAQPKLVNSFWGIDVAANQVVVTLPSDAVARGDERVATLTAAAARHASAVRVEQAPVTLSTQSGGPSLNPGPDVAGGDPARSYQNPADACTAGFNVTDGSQRFVLLAGHCMNPAYTDWMNWDGYYPLGVRHAAYFPTLDYGLIRITGGESQIPGVYLNNGSYRHIDRARDAFQGEFVCKSGIATGLTCGLISITNTSANYAQGTVYLLDAGHICSRAGDSGGPLVSVNDGLGTLSGGTGHCDNYHLMWAMFEPLTIGLAVYGLSLSTF